jgi:hypothetical protein
MLRIPKNTQIGFLIWNDFLRRVIEFCLGTIDSSVVFHRFLRDSSGLSSEFLKKLSNIDILVIEAFNPQKHKDPEGFRLAMKIMELGFKTKPLVIFRRLEERFLIHPSLIDYRTIYNLPDKLQQLMEASGVTHEDFRGLLRAYPVLKSKPVHP